MRVVRVLLALHALGPSALRAQADERSSVPEAEVRTIGYAEALNLVEEAPGLRARAAAAKGFESARERVSGLPADLTFSAELGPRVSPDVAAQGRLGVAQNFSLGGLGDARREVLSSAGSAMDAERALARFERRVEVARAWLEVHYAQQAADVARNELRLAEDFARVTNRGAELHELTRADAADATAYAAEAKLNLLAAEGALADARFELTRALAVKDRILDAGGDAPGFSLPSHDRAHALHVRLRQAPALAALALESSLVRARARELEALHASQLGVGVIADRTDPKAFAALGTLSITLPWSSRSVREREELASSQTLLAGRLAEAEARAHVELERLLHEIEHARAVLEQAEQKLLPAIETGLAAREALFRAGEGNAFEVILARRAALAQRVRRERLRTDLWFALARYAELARALGAEP